jgi:hypothetical protein
MLGLYSGLEAAGWRLVYDFTPETGRPDRVYASNGYHGEDDTAYFRFWAQESSGAWRYCYEQYFGWVEGHSDLTVALTDCGLDTALCSVTAQQILNPGKWYYLYASEDYVAFYTEYENMTGYQGIVRLESCHGYRTPIRDNAAVIADQGVYAVDDVKGMQAGAMMVQLTDGYGTPLEILRILEVTQMELVGDKLRGTIKVEGGNTASDSFKSTNGYGLTIGRNIWMMAYPGRNYWDSKTFMPKRKTTVSSSSVYALSSVSSITASSTVSKLVNMRVFTKRAYRWIAYYLFDSTSKRFNLSTSSGYLARYLTSYLPSLYVQTSTSTPKRLFSFGAVSEAARFVTTATGSSITDLAMNWQTDQYKDKTVIIVDGKGAGQARLIVSNTSNTLNVGTAFELPLDDTSIYRIVESCWREVGGQFVIKEQF